MAKEFHPGAENSRSATEFNLCDNRGPIALSKNARLTPRTKHINGRHHFIKEKIETKKIEVKFISTNQMLADPLTKATTSSKLEAFLKEVGLKDM